jgi:flagellar secretion chaperone FliS
MNAPHMRNRYLQDSIDTASPAKLLNLLYDRLVLDLGQGEEAIRAKDRDTASERITHAQEIIMELRTTLDVEVWEGGPGLAALYGFLLTELIQANIRLDADKVSACRGIVEPLRDAWREAAVLAVAVPATIGK